MKKVKVVLLFLVTFVALAYSVLITALHNEIFIKNVVGISFASFPTQPKVEFRFLPWNKETEDMICRIYDQYQSLIEKTGEAGNRIDHRYDWMFYHQEDSLSDNDIKTAEDAVGIASVFLKGLSMPYDVVLDESRGLWTVYSVSPNGEVEGFVILNRYSSTTEAYWRESGAE